MDNSWHKYSLFFLLIVAAVGSLLRSGYMHELPLEYAHLVHAHSHVAFQGWIYTIMMLLLCRFYLTTEQIQSGRYRLQFKLTIPLIIAILVSFSVQGYALYSIIFSTLFQALNLWFIYSFFRDTRVKNNEQQAISLHFIKSGLYFNLISMIFPFVIGFLSAKSMANTELYQSCVYAFLHMQYNGWFIFIGLGLFFKLLEYKEIRYDKQYARVFLRIFQLALIPAIALSLLGMSFANSPAVYLPAYFAAILQLVGAFYFFKSIKGAFRALIRQSHTYLQGLYLFVASCFIIKLLGQSSSALPALMPLAFQNKAIILAYLHLSLIGVLSFFFLTLSIETNWLRLDKFKKLGLLCLFGGFCITEILLVLAGINIVHNNNLLFWGSVLMCLGICCLIPSLNNKAVPKLIK